MSDFWNKVNDWWNKSEEFAAKASKVLTKMEEQRRQEINRLKNKYQREASRLSDEELIRIYKNGISDRLKCMCYRQELINRGLARPKKSD